MDVRVGGQSYRLVTSSDPDALQRYAEQVDQRLRSITSSGAVHPQGLVLVALALVHELEQERCRREQGEQRARQALHQLLERIDAALDSVDENGDPLPPRPVQPSAPL